MEQTLVLLKPDCVQKAICGEVVSRFEKAGFKIRATKMTHLSSELLREHYAHLVDKPFYPSIEKFMQSSPVIALILEGESAIQRVREMLGPTDSTKAAKGTIRGDFGVDVQLNVVHASDSAEASAAERKRFFRAEEIF